MRKPTERRARRRGRFVHLGERLASIERIRAGEISRVEAAAQLGVDEAEVLRWIQLHQDERLVTFDELRQSAGSRNGRLAARARRLAALLAMAERRVRELHLELISKELGEKPHRGAQAVAPAQPQGA